MDSHIGNDTIEYSVEYNSFVNVFRRPVRSFEWKEMCKD